MYSDMNTYEQHSTRKLIATILSVLLVAGVVVIVDHFRAESRQMAPVAQVPRIATVAVTPSASPAPTTTSLVPTVAPAVTPVQSSGYTDGSFNASSDYYVPSGNETIKVTLTLRSGVVADAQIGNSASDRESARYQQDFASVYKSYVVGKKISNLRIGVIAGASDTSQGFNDALSKIAAKAQA